MDQTTVVKTTFYNHVVLIAHKPSHLHQLALTLVEMVTMFHIPTILNSEKLLTPSLEMNNL